MFNRFKRRRNEDTSYETNEDWVKALSAPVDEKAVEKPAFSCTQ